jgi:hypothetical protein
MNRFLNFLVFFLIALDCQAQGILQAQLTKDARQFPDRGGESQSVGAANGATHVFAPYVTPLGAPSLVDLGKAITDMGSLRGWGYVGDGASHPLASIETFNGVSAVGWSLSRWRTVLPAATALTDEIDGVAI